MGPYGQVGNEPPGAEQATVAGERVQPEVPMPWPVFLLCMALLDVGLVHAIRFAAVLAQGGSDALPIVLFLYCWWLVWGLQHGKPWARILSTVSLACSSVALAFAGLPFGLAGEHYLLAFVALLLSGLMVSLALLLYNRRGNLYFGKQLPASQPICPACLSPLPVDGTDLHACLHCGQAPATAGPPLEDPSSPKDLLDDENE